MGKDVLDAFHRFLLQLVEERDKLAADLQLDSPTRERHALIRDGAQAVVDAIAPPEQTPAEAEVAAQAGTTPGAVE